MKKTLLSTVTILSVCTMVGTTIAGDKIAVPRTVQGVEYSPDQRKGSPGTMSRDWDWTDPDDMAADGSFTMDMIQSWCGEGENQAALVIQWNDDEEPAALVFGYRWDGVATGADMVRAVVAANPRLYGLIQYTNVSSPTDPRGGYTINGFGWDVDNDGEIGLVDTKDNTVYRPEDGLQIHPRGYDPDKGGSSDYDYDDWKALDPDDMWGAGWYLSYWSYWVKDDFESKFSYSSWGASGRVLQNGSWDGWNFSLDMIPRDWKKFAAAPALIPDGAKTEFEYGGLCFSLKDYQAKRVMVSPTENGSYAGEITVPETITDEDITYTVVEVGEGAFKDCAVTSVALPATVTKIGASAFENSTLETLSIPDINAVKSIGARAFAGCAHISTPVFPSSMTSVPEGMYRGTGIETLEIPAWISAIDKAAFADCARLTCVKIPATVKSIGEEAFAGCDALTQVECESTFPLQITPNVFSEQAYAAATLSVPSGFTSEYRNAEGWSNFATVKEFTIPVNAGDIFRAGGVTYEVTSALTDSATVRARYCKTEGNPDRAKVMAANKAGYVGNVTIPSTVTYQERAFAVTELSDSIFYGATALTGADIQAPVTRIGKYAFNECEAITSILLPTTVKTIDTYAFAYCSVIKEIQLPESVEALEGERTFFQCNALERVNIPAGVTSLPRYCFSYCNALQEMILGAEITALGDNLFQNCTSLRKVVLPDGLKKLPNYIFSSCGALAEAKIPESVTEIGQSCFSGCAQWDFNMPAGVTSIGSEAFKGCAKITEFTFPAQMTEIPSYVLQDCAALTKVTLGDNVTSFGYGVFRNCTSLNEMTTKDGQTGFNLPSSLTSIGSYCFLGCKGIREAILPEGIKILGINSLQNSGLEALVLPAALTANITNNNIVQDCKDVTIYASMSAPGRCGTYTWRISGQTFAPVVVPTGTKAAYEAQNYWSKSALSEPVLENISLADMQAISTSNGEAIVTGRVSGMYDLADLPRSFAKANDALIFGGKTVTLRMATAAEASRAARSAEENSLTVTLDADGAFSATIPVEEGAGTISLAVNDGEMTSAAVEVPLIQPFEFKDKEYDAHFDEKYTPELIFNIPDYTKDDVEFTCSDTNVASVVKRTGAVSVKRVEGDAVITATLKSNPDIKAEMTIHSALRNPVTGFILGNGNSRITLTYMDILALSPMVEPANADIQSYDISVSDTEIATTYAAKAFNPTRNFYELVTHKPGEVDVTFTAQDGSGVSSTYHVTVEEPDRRKEADNYEDGTFWLNEDWFGHTNGSINYITKDGELKYRVYESQNPYESFGCTSQYGIIHGGKLIVMSKQATDKGDPRTGGGRVVVADANTLKTLAKFDNIDPEGKGDGRACIGVDENKVYLGSTAGVRVLDTRTLTLGNMVEGLAAGSQYANQYGDMAASGNYVFLVQQNTGVHVIDTESDTVVLTFGLQASEETGAEGIGYPQGITESKDGNIWVATTEKQSSGLCTLVCINPETLEIIDRVTLPESQRITCGWGSWRSTNFFASKTDNSLWWGAGVEASIVSGNTGYYKWEIGTDLPTTPVFVFPSKLPGINETTYQAPYASVRYDDRTDRLLMATTHGASSNYRYTWLNWIDCKTGEISKTIRMKDYYWFPALPIFPDKYAPEFGEMPELRFTPDNNAPVEIDLSEIVTDRDNHDVNIKVERIFPEKSESAREAGNTLDDIAEVTLEGKKLTVVPRANAVGKATLTLKAESNGRVSTIDIPVINDTSTEVDLADAANGTISIVDRRITASGMNGAHFTVYDMAGVAVSAFTADSDRTSVVLTVPAGVYILTAGDRTFKFSVK